MNKIRVSDGVSLYMRLRPSDKGLQFGLVYGALHTRVILGDQSRNVQDAPFYLAPHTARSVALHRRDVVPDDQKRLGRGHVPCQTMRLHRRLLAASLESDLHGRQSRAQWTSHSTPLSGKRALGGLGMVGVARFERATTCTPYRCATRLRHTPTPASVAKGSGHSKTAGSGTIETHIRATDHHEQEEQQSAQPQRVGEAPEVLLLRQLAAAEGRDIRGLASDGHQGLAADLGGYHHLLAEGRVEDGHIQDQQVDDLDMAGGEIGLLEGHLDDAVAVGNGHALQTEPQVELPESLLHVRRLSEILGRGLGQLVGYRLP